MYDFLVIQFKNNKIASNAYLKLNKTGISTGILPVASRWHYAGYWKHIFKDNPKFTKYNLKTWKNSWSQISTSLSLPISIIENSKDLKIKFNKIKKILNNIDVN